MDEDSEEVGYSPVVGELAVVDSEDIDGVKRDGSAGGGDAEEFSVVGATVGLEGGDFIVVDCLPVDFGVQVRERCA